MPGRPTTIRDRHRAIIKRGRPPCALCGEAIDYDANWLDPRAFVVDHIVPLFHGGTDTLTNKQAAHRECNARKGKRNDGLAVVKHSGSLK